MHTYMYVSVCICTCIICICIYICTHTHTHTHMQNVMYVRKELAAELGMPDGVDVQVLAV
jgi:hypothetical protein